jgi:hypothetical protein
MKRTAFFLVAGVLCALLVASGCTGTVPASTATPAPATAVPASSLPEVTTPAAPSLQTANWAGTWNTTWLETDNNLTVSQVVLSQSGPDVTGTYTFAYPGEGPYTGHLNATASGKTLTGMYAESDDDSGFLVFEQSENRTSFTGRWVHSENQSMLAGSTLWWNGTRV